MTLLPAISPETRRYPVTTALRRPSPALAVAVVSAALLLAGCSSGTPEAEPTPTAEDTDEVDPNQPVGEGEQPGGNGISGLIAAITDSVMQVQSTDSQTAVTWTDETEVTRTVTVGLDSITVGSCVFATAPTAEEGSTAATVATSVTVSDPVDGECAAGFESFGGAGGQATGEMPEDFEVPEGMTVPEDGELPEGMEGMTGGSFGQMVNGLVTAVSGTTLTVEATDADGVVTTETIETDAETVVTATVEADTTAIAVGLCATVGGETDTRGGMTATTIALSDAGEDGCTTATGGGRMPANGGEDE